MAKIEEAVEPSILVRFNVKEAKLLTRRLREEAAHKENWYLVNMLDELISWADSQ